MKLLLALAAVMGATPEGFVVQDGYLKTSSGAAVYEYAYDTMVGMSHCEGGCARQWPAVKAPPGAKPKAPWSLISREDGSLQWALHDKPLYTSAAPTPPDKASPFAPVPASALKAR